MKILRIYTRLPPLIGGMENHIVQLTKEQIKIGHDVSIYFNHGDSLTTNDVQVTKIPLFKIKPQFIGLLVFHLLVLVRLIINRRKFDVVHIHGDWSSMIFSKLVKLLVCAEKLVFTIHDQLTENIIKKSLLNVAIRHADVIFSTGYKAADELRKLTNKKVIVQPSGVNKIFFSGCDRKFEKKQLQVITVANLIKKKNLGLILDIAKDKPTLNFIIVGKGKEKAFLKNRILSESINNVKILDYKNSKELLLLYCQSDIFLFTSFKEGTPAVILEAATCGLPIVCSSAGGVKSILHNQNFIIEKNSKSKFVNCLSILDSNNALRESISLKNKIHSEGYTWKNVALNVDKYIQK